VLDSVPFVNGQANGTPVVVDSSLNWGSTGAFVVSAADVHDQPPVAAFSADCGATGTACTFDASSSTDSDGNVVSYAWDYGDGQSDSSATSQSAHTYAADGSYPVTLTVTDDDGATASVTHTVHVDVAPPAPIQFVDSATKYANATTESLTVPADTATGDAMLLFDTFTSATATTSGPSGWTEVGRNSRGAQTTVLYERVANASDAGSTVTATYSVQAKASLVLATYSGADQANPIQKFDDTTAAGVASDTAPALGGLADGSVVVSFWADRSSATTSFTPPAAVTQRALQFGAGSATVNALLADSGTAVSGAYPSQTATTNDASADSSSWSVALQQSTT
jgi:PKD repeat protein